MYKSVIVLVDSLDSTLLDDLACEHISMRGLLLRENEKKKPLLLYKIGREKEGGGIRDLVRGGAHGAGLSSFAGVARGPPKSTCLLKKRAI